MMWESAEVSSYTCRGPGVTCRLQPLPCAGLILWGWWVCSEFHGALTWLFSLQVPQSKFPMLGFLGAKAASLGRSIQLHSVLIQATLSFSMSRIGLGAVGLTVWVSQLCPKTGSRDCWAKELRRATGEQRFSQISKVSVQGWFSTVCLSFSLCLRFKILRNGAVLLLEWQFNSPVILSCYVPVTATGIWKKLWFDAMVRGVCLAFPRNLWISVQHHPSWLQKLLLSFKISLVLFSLSPQSASSLCWTMPRSIFSKPFDSRMCYKICSLCPVWM